VCLCIYDLFHILLSLWHPYGSMESMYVFMYVRMYVCMYVCMCVCMYVRICACVCVCVCVYVRTYVRMYVCTYYVCMCMCVYTCVLHMYVFMYVCMYVCMQRFNSFGIRRHVKLTNSSRYFQEICCLNVQALSHKDLQNICNYLFWTPHHIPEDLNLQHGHCMKNFNMVTINNGLLWFDMLDIQCHKL
jgi:hypothetical protein